MNKKFKLFITIFVLMCSISLQGCGNSKEVEKTDSKSQTSEISNEEIKGKVVFWHTYSDTEEAAFKNILPKFNEKYPEVNVESVRMPVDGLKQQLITAISGGVQPDVMRMDIIWTPEFAKMGVLEKLDNKPSFKEIADEIFEGPLKTNMYNESYYGLPLNTNCKILAWNVKLMEKAGINQIPSTIEEFETVAKKIVGKNSWGYGMQCPDSWGSTPLFYSLGGTFTSGDFTKAEGYTNSENSVKALETIVRWHDEGIIGPSIFGEEPNTWGGMENNQYLMIDDGPWLFSLVEHEGKMLPSLFLEGKGGSRSVIGGENVVNFSGKNTDAAWELTKFMLSDEAQLAMTDAGIIPVKKKCVDNEIVQKNPITKIYLDQMKTAQARIVHPSYNEIDQEIKLVFDKALRKEGEPKELLDNLAKKIDSLLSE